LPIASMEQSSLWVVEGDTQIKSSESENNRRVR